MCNLKKLIDTEELNDKKIKEALMSEANIGNSEVKH